MMNFQLHLINQEPHTSIAIPKMTNAIERDNEGDEDARAPSAAAAVAPRVEDGCETTRIDFIRLPLPTGAHDVA